MYLNTFYYLTFHLTIFIFYIRILKYFLAHNSMLYIILILLRALSDFHVLGVIIIFYLGIPHYSVAVFVNAFIVFLVLMMNVPVPLHHLHYSDFHVLLLSS